MEVVVKIKFSEIRNLVESTTGIYEIYLNDGTPLKVGIAKNLRSRLRMHFGSKQRRLKIKNCDDPITPNNMQSKQSIFAKHLYFDSTISTTHDLTTETGRVEFLENCCFLTFQYTESREVAREIEKEYEKSGKYRYVGRVVKR